MSAIVILMLLLQAQNARPGDLAGADSDDAQLPKTLPPVRRIYVPADRVPEMADRFPQLHSMDRADFESLLQRVRRATDTETPFLKFAEMYATLDGDRLRGTGKWQIPIRRDDTSLVHWAVGNWSIASARWVGHEDAIFGYAGTGRMALVVPAGEARSLDLDWSAPTEVLSTGYRFDFPIPRAIRTELTVDLPLGFIPIASGGVVSKLSETVATNLVRWRICWSPCDRVALSILHDAGPQPVPSFVAYERHLEADVSVEATDILARFRLAVNHQPIEFLEFSFSPGVEIYSWSGLKVRDSEIRDGKLRILLAEPIQGAEQFTLHTLAPGLLGERWQLPHLEISGATCTGGSLRLNAVPGITLTDVGAPPTVQVSLGSAAERGEWILQDVRPEDSVMAHGVATATLLIARIRTAIEVGSRIQADMNLACEVAAGDTNTIQVRLPAYWSVQAVEGIQGPAITRWFSTAAGQGESIVTLQLNRTAYTGSAISLLVRLSGPTIDTSLATTRVAVPRARLIGGTASDESVTVRSDSAWSVELVETVQVTVSASEDVDASDTAPIRFRFDGPQGAGVMLIARRAAEYAGKLDTQVNVNEQFVEAKYQFDLEWPAKPPETLDVFWTAPTGSDLRWELPPGIQVIPLVRDDEQEEGMESWRIRLRQKTGRRLRFVARRRTELSSELVVPLPVLGPGSGSTGSVVVRHAQELVIEPTVRGLVPVPPSSVSQGAVQNDDRSDAWRYGLESPHLALDIARNQQLHTPVPWVALARLRSSFEESGTSLHRVAYRLMNAAGCTFDLQFPAGAVIRRASMPGADVTPVTSNLLRVSGPASLDSWDLLVDYSMTARAWGRCVVQSTPLPTMPYAVSRVVWEVEVPAGYDVVNSSSGLTPVPPLAMSDGMQRLFGPLLRRDGTLFRFWDTSAWHSWWKGVPPEDDFRGRLADSLRDFAGSVRPRDRTWSRLCTHLNQFAGNRLVVDTVALERATISLQDEAVLTETALPEELFGLASSGAMNLVRTHRGLLLTTRAESAELTEHSEKGLRWLREDSGLPAAIDQATVMGADSSGRFVRSSMLEQTSGKGEFANQCEPFVFAHDAATLRFEAADYPQDLSLMLIERPLVIGWAAFVGACLTIAAGVPRARPAHRAFVTAGLVVAVGFAMTLIVPEPLIAPCVTLAWGTLAVLAWWSHLPAAEPVRGATERRVPVVAVRAGTVSLIALLLVQAHAVHGQSEPDRKEQNYINVFIPYDPSHPESRQSGGRVMMPRPTYDRLLKLAESDLSGLVLIRSTAISGLLAGTRMELNIDVELESFTALQPTRVLIPLRGMVVRSAFLDDQPCPVEQAPGGLYVECSGSGRHQLHLSCVLSLAPDDTSGSLDLSIPPGGRTALELILPADLELKLESAVTQERYLEGSKQRFRADLAGDGSLVAHWSRAPAMPVRLQSDIAMLLTWHGAIAHLEMRALIRVQGLTRQLIIETDPRLSLKGVNAPGLTGYSQLAGPEKVEWYLDFDRPLDRTVPIAFDCLLQSAGGDELRIPEIDVRGARAGSKLLAVSGSEESKYQLVESITGQLGSVDEFRTVWKEELPRAVRSIIRLPSEARGATVRRVREQTRPVLELQTDLRVTRGRTMMQARFAADVLSKGVWHQLELPARFNLSNVRTSPGTYWRLLKGSGESTPDTVPALGNGVVDPLDGAQQSILWLGVPSGDTTPTVEIDGWLPHPEGAEPIPLVRSDRACSFSGTLNIWRARDLTIELNNVRGMTAEPTGVELKPPSAEFAAESQFRFEGFDYSGDWKMESRPARVATTVATRVLVDDKAAEWICVVEYQVMDGALDTVMLGLPAAFPGSIQISGEGISHREVSDHGGNQVWKITLSQPRWQPFRLMLRAPIGVESDGHIAVPIAVPQGEIVDLKQFLLVLNATDHKLRIDGLGPHESVPSETFRKWFSEPITKSVSGSYELKGASGFADVGPLAATSSAADHVVGLERHRAWIGARGPVWLHSTLFVRARSSGAFMLRLPHGSSIYRLLINGQTVRPNTEPNGQLSVFLSETDRPYQITALSRRDNDTELSSKTTVQFSRLTKSDCPSLWTISLPSRYPLLSATSSDTCLSALQVAEAAALANELEYLLELPRTSDDADRSTIVAELQDSFLSAVEQAQQTAAWEREIQQSSRRLEVDRERAVRELRGLVQSNQRMWQRLGAMGIRLSDEPQPFRPRGHAPFLVSDGDTDTDRLVAIHTAGPFGTPRFYVTHGADLSIELDRNPQSLSLGVLIPAFLIGLAGWCTSLLFALPGGQLRRWFAVFAFGGLFWSWNLRPAPIGPLLLIIAIMMFTLIVARRMQRARV